MAHHPSAEKRNRQRLVRTERNTSVRSAVRTAVKKARTALSDGDRKAAEQSVRLASKALAKAARKGVLHGKTASRRTGRIQAALHKLTNS
ncbi:MAG: 30S ribosomal protein S20 [Polyangiaceae bacterium]|nr:30S ribosomal protein S20 [Polyangiaceae bacterium]